MQANNLSSVTSVRIKTYWLNEAINCVAIDFGMVGIVGIECTGSWDMGYTAAIACTAVT